MSLQVSVCDPSFLEGEATSSLWLSCHGYDSRSVLHLDVIPTVAPRRLSLGFDFPDPEGDEENAAFRLLDAHARLRDGNFDVRIVDDVEFEQIVSTEILSLNNGKERPLVTADVSSMNRTRIASLILACASGQMSRGCGSSDLVYFPSTFLSHKHPYEPLEFFRPGHAISPAGPRIRSCQLALIVGLGTEPRRADGIVETVEPDILGIFEPFGDEPSFQRTFSVRIDACWTLGENQSDTESGTQSEPLFRWRGDDWAFSSCASHRRATGPKRFLCAGCERSPGTGTSCGGLEGICRQRGKANKCGGSREAVELWIRFDQVSNE